ncbi:hypothetical protein K439DRAFT_1640708 [Ramaria rubella]|nr:hypothetical protein K439DRAFT_1640708 [Ramaria rubella]
MVFTNLTEEDKEAFFALLDEYFATRPELADALHLASPARSGINNNNVNSGVAAAHRALASNPQATNAAISTGLRSVPKSSPYASAASNPEVANAVGRFAAASLAFNGSAPKAPTPRLPSGSNSDLKPPPPPRRTASNSSLSTTSSDQVLPPPRTPPKKKKSLPGGLVTQQKIGDLDTSSSKKMLWGVRNKEPPPPTAPVPSAFASTPRKPIAPPPRRGTVPMPRARTPTPEPEPESEPEYEGEWAEALYDYNSSDPNDLPLQAEQRVLVIARTSDDWWTGEVDGKSGLFPSTYVKML